MKAGNYSKTNIFMWVVYPVGLVTFILFMFFTCTSKSLRGQGNEESALPADTIKKKEFIMPVIPKELTVPQDRANYLITHYWDNFDFSDTTYIHLPEITEQAFANYIEVLSHGAKPTSYFSINDMLLKAEAASPEVHRYFLSCYKKYLYDPNSPLRNEEYYIPVVNQILKSAKTGAVDRERAEYTMSLLLKNRVGEKATDITYTQAFGKTGRLYDIQGQYTLLYFYNPDCQACEQTTHYMKESDFINSLVKAGILKIAMIYPDKDIDLWKEHLNDIPKAWINGYDKHMVINDRQLYDLKAIPTLYLLDKDKNILLKDTEITKAETYIRENTPLMFP